REVIGVEECSPAGVVRQRDQRFLRAKISIVLTQDSSARINGTAAASTAARWGTPSTTRAGGAAAGNDRLESAHVDGIKGKVRSSSSIDGSTQLCLIFHTGSLHSAAEIDNGLPLRNRAQIIRQVR